MSVLGRVTESDEGRFIASVEYVRDQPFSIVFGPQGVDAGTAVGWARDRARRVIVVLGDGSYSAGVERVDEYEDWVPPAAFGPAAGLAVGDMVAWGVDASFVWMEPGVEEVARRYGSALENEAEVSSVDARADGRQVDLTFRITARSEVAAHETASAKLRAAWASSGLADGVVGAFGFSGLSVSPLAVA